MSKEYSTLSDTVSVGRKADWEFQFAVAMFVGRDAFLEL